MADSELSDFEAARTWLLRMFGPDTADRLMASLEAAPTVSRMACDIVRTGCITLIPKDNLMVAHFMRHLRRGNMFKPLLLVEWRPLIVADGHHRLAASFYTDPGMLIPCKVA